MAGTQFVWRYRTRGGSIHPYGVRYTLIIRPSGPPESSWTSVEIPEDAVNIPQLSDLSQVSFGDLFLGLPEAPQWKFQFRMDRLRSGDLLTLHDKLLKESYIQTTSSLPNIPRDFATTNFFMLLWDEGTGSEPDSVLFQGAQWRPQESEGMVRPTTGQHWLGIDVIDINKAVMETVTPQDIQSFFFDSYIKSQHLPNWGLEGSGNVYDSMYRNGGRNFARCQRLKAESTKLQLARFWPLFKLFEVIQALCRSAYRFHVRDALATYTFSGVGTGNTPYDVFQFYKQTYALSSGAIARGSLLADTAVYFIGIIWNDGAVVDTYPDDVGNIIGGFLSENDDGLFAYKNVWEFMGHCTIGCKVQYAPTSSPAMALTFARPGDRSATRTLKPSDFKGVGLSPTEFLEVSYTRNMSMIGSVEVSARGLGDADSLESTIEIDHIPPSVADGPNLEFVFHNLPSIGDSADRYQLAPGDDTALSEDLEEPYIVAASSGFNCRCLYYFEWPGTDLITHSDQIPIRVHDQVAWEWDSTTVYDDGANVSGYPTPTVSGFVLETTFDVNFWIPLKVVYAEAQNTSCLPFIVGYRIAYNFSRDGQLGFEVEVPIGLAPPDAIGDWYDLHDENGNDIGANILLGGGTAFDDLGTKAYYLKGDFQIENPTVKATFLIPGEE